ncbi:hypothetical protein KJ616_02850 [Patescibacteria group bacterium]|nr:hypothetical protein [Patescibacteria group bacterium]
MKKENQISPKIVSLSFAILVLLLVSAFYIFAWTEPTTAPPGGNVAVPLNTGSDSQYKVGKLGAFTSGIDPSYGLTIGSSGIKATGNSYFEGALTATTDITANDDIVFNGELMPDGATCSNNQILQKIGADNWDCVNMPSGGTLSGSGTANYISKWTAGTTLGNSQIFDNGTGVGIGTSNPGSNKLYVNGNAFVNGILDMGNHKIANVTEIDPVFGIDGKKYVTYMPDSIGQKIEVVGEAQLTGGKLEIDLAGQPEGSDLWLFWQTAYQESIIPFVSPQDNASLYAYIDGSRFIVKLAQGQENTRFSYRLIATRLDHANDQGNLYSDQGVQYFIDIDQLRK